MDTLFQDVRYGFRLLRKSPVFTLVVVLTLALGIGANTAIFSVINGVLLRPLPFHEPDQVVGLFETNLSRGMAEETLSPANFLDLSSQNHSFTAVAAYLRGPMALTGRGDAARLRVVSASPSLFEVLGVNPAIGRGMLAEDISARHGHVAVLSHHLWSSRFGSDAGIVGKNIRLDGEEYAVIGVMSEQFQFPISGSDLWVPLLLDNKVWVQRGAHFLSGVGRLKPGASLASAKADLNTIGARLAAQYPRTNKGYSLGTMEFHQELVGDVKPALLILLASVGLVVLIACANIANLLLARSSERDREVAIRSALGATPMRVRRQLLTESLMLSLMGAVVGVVVAAWVIKIILQYGPQDIPRIQSVQLDSHVLMFSLLLAVVTGVIFGVLPAFHASHPQLSDSLKSGSRVLGDHEGRLLRSSLVAGEIALSLVLLAGAGLLLRSFLRLQSVDPGFNPAGLLTLDLALPEIRYPDGNRVAVFSNDLLERMRSLPGVESAALVQPAPLSGNDYSSSFKVNGQPPSPNDDDRSAEVRIVTRDYFQTMQIPLLRGRVFATTDRRDASPVVVISRSAEKKFFPNEDALGKEMTFGARIGYDKVGGQIVGIVGDVHDFGLQTEPPPDAYVLQDQAGVNEMSVLIRTKADPLSLAAAVREKVRGLDGNLPIAAMSTMETALGESLAQRRFYMLLLGIFAASAILLAAVGVYGVMTYSVSRRTQEIGIRLALGARHQELLALLMRQTALLVTTGLVIGLTITAASGRILTGLLFGIRPSDPLIIVSSTCGMALVALLAGYVPLRRVLKVDPMVALRYE